MPITLNDFLAVSNGTYNAGQIDFKTNKKGEVTGLKKVNNHVTLSSRNAVAIDPKRAVAVKEAFLKALAGGGVSAQNLANIRAKLGLAPFCLQLHSNKSGKSALILERVESSW